MSNQQAHSFRGLTFAGLPRDGYVAHQPLTPWEQRACEAVGTTIEFWGFKRNQGRVWALLYLRGDSLTAGELQAELGLSKGAISMLTRELEGWEVLHRIRDSHSGRWRFAANTNFMAMIRRVFEQREAQFVGRVTGDLKTALDEARANHATPPAVIERLERMYTFGARIERTLAVFLRSARLDLRGAVDALRHGLAEGGG